MARQMAPRSTEAHLETYLDLFSPDFGPEIKEKKKARGIVTAHSKRLSALEIFVLILRLLLLLLLLRLLLLLLLRLLLLVKVTLKLKL